MTAYRLFLSLSHAAIQICIHFWQQIMILVVWQKALLHPKWQG